MYLYPENLTARPMLWLWTLRRGVHLHRSAAVGIGTDTGRHRDPAGGHSGAAFLCIRHGGISMLDFLCYAAAFFFFGQQYYEWRERV